mmetsp:Transcript_2251/g.2551  ORF Transcript_2251/g.2551 Transcript_2251/m.2551 type:complete len:111 (+) Transcript_2251:341-673(+)
MGRFSAFVGGVLCGATAYGSLSLWSQAEFARINHQIRSIHLELAGGAVKQLPPPEDTIGIFNVGPLAELRAKAVDAFKTKWNEGLRLSFDTIQKRLHASPSVDSVQESTN